MSSYKFVILGGGLVAGYAAREFVNQGVQSGELCIVSAEAILPYERPPLSKGFLAGEKTVSDLWINDASFYTEHGIDVKLDMPVQQVDLSERVLHTHQETISYEKLLIATGARPRTFNVPGAMLENLYYLRQVEDARQIRRMSQKAEKAVVIGGGFIAMETTAVLQSQGVATTMLFPGERVWESFFTPLMSAFFENFYRDRGVTLMPRQEVDSFVGDHNGRVNQVVTKTGLTLPADMVVAGIGVTPNSDLFQDGELQMKDEFILVNRFLETNMPFVLAAGDVTYYEDVVYQRPLHVEHWDNAVQQGQHAARVMLGLRQPYEHVPYFFSDVFDLSYEFWGDTRGATEAIHRGEVNKGQFSVWWLAEDGRLLAAFIMDRPAEEKELAAQWIQAGKRLSPTWLSETNMMQL